MNKEIITKNTETTESKIQFILDENGELQEISKEKCRIVEYPIKYKLKNAFEVFVCVDGTENYWISNYGRCVNNLNHKDKNRFYKHKEGKCHYTIFEIEREIQSRSKKKRKSRGKTKTKSVKDVRTHKYFSADKPIEECNSFLQELQEADEKRTYFIQEYKREERQARTCLLQNHF